MAAYLILVLHVLLLAGVGVITVFISGVANYMGWILLGGFTLIGSGCYSFYRLLRREGNSLRAMMDSPMLSNRDVEVNLLGGFASIKVSAPKDGSNQIAYQHTEAPRQLNYNDSQPSQEKKMGEIKIAHHTHDLSGGYGGIRDISMKNL